MQQAMTVNHEVFMPQCFKNQFLQIAILLPFCWTTLEVLLSDMKEVIELHACGMTFKLNSLVTSVKCERSASNLVMREIDV